MTRSALQWLLGALVLLSCAIAGASYAAEAGAPDAAPQADTDAGSPPADAPAGSATGRDTGSVDTTSPSAPEDSGAPAGEAARADGPGGSPDAFIPSETISEDFNVAFPVDI
jgi:hypothetical protein